MIAVCCYMVFLKWNVSLLIKSRKYAMASHGVAQPVTGYGLSDLPLSPAFSQVIGSDLTAAGSNHGEPSNEVWRDSYA